MCRSSYWNSQRCIRKMKKESYAKKCDFYFRGLEYTANLYQIIYFLGIFVPVILGIISVGFYPNDRNLPTVALCFSIFPFMVLLNIPKIQKYRELSKKYHVLSMNFQNRYSKTLPQQYGDLCEELSKYDVNFVVKFFMKKD